MITVITYLPAKYSDEVRKQYIIMAESLIEKVCKVPKTEIALVNRFVPMDEICHIGADTKTMYLYYQEEWTLEMKAELTRLYDEECQKMFGDDKGMTIVICKPHQMSEVVTGK